MRIVRHLFGWALFASAGIALTGAAPAPEISLAIRGVEDETTQQGEPLHVVVRLNAPRKTAAVISLAPASGTWSEAIVVEITRGGGEAALVRAIPLGNPDSPVATLDARHVAGGLWRFSPEAMQGVAPGSYVVRARLVIRNGSGWTGEVVSDEAPLQIVAVVNSTDGVSQRTAIRTRDAMLAGHWEEAAKLVDTVLALAPDDERLLALRAEVALRAGNPMAAMICLNRADHPSGSGQPDVEREELKTRALTALYREDADPLNPPAWSWPPASVLMPSRDKEVTGQKTSDAKTPIPAAATNPPAGITPKLTGAPPQNSASALPIAPTERRVSGALPSGVGVVVLSAELSEQKILSDPNGQWAASAVASSQYGNPQYSPMQATGAPTATMAGNSPDAWCPINKNAGTDWLEVAFARPVNAAEVRALQNDAPGTIAKVEAIEPDGTSHVWWEGVDPYQAPRIRETAWFVVRVPKTDYLVAKIKLTLDLSRQPGWKEIDAVQLVASP